MVRFELAPNLTLSHQAGENSFLCLHATNLATFSSTTHKQKSFHRLNFAALSWRIYHADSKSGSVRDTLLTFTQIFCPM